MTNYAQHTYRKPDPDCPKCEGEGRTRREVSVTLPNVTGPELAMWIERCTCTDIDPTQDAHDIEAWETEQ